MPCSWQNSTHASVLIADTLANRLVLIHAITSSIGTPARSDASCGVISSALIRHSFNFDYLRKWNDSFAPAKYATATFRSSFVTLKQAT